MKRFQLPLGTRLRLEKKHNRLAFVFSDIDRLQDWVIALKGRTPRFGAPLSDRYFLELMSIHILIVSLLEYSLKCVRMAARQHELIERIRSSPVMRDLEKDWLVYLILTRHTVVHNFGHHDKDLEKNMRKHIRKLRVVPGDGDSWLTVFVGTQFDLCLELLKKYLFLDVLSNDLTVEELQCFRRYFDLRFSYTIVD